VQAQVINLLVDLKEAFGLTLVIIAHDLAVVRHMSDRIVVMYLGQIVELADKDQLFTEPLHPYTQALLAAVPSAEPGVRSPRLFLEGDPPNPLTPPEGCRFHPRCPAAKSRCRTERPELRVASDQRKVACHFWQEIDGFAPESPTKIATNPARDHRFALYRAAVERHQDRAAD
ncbi:MAG: oligopeptide/dipeptide ABC transporter ATP-binding protein, partial [Geminicoccaceae bacterium]